MTTKITDKNISNLANFGIQWQSVITADGSTVTSLEAGKGYFIDTSSAAGIVSLPTSSSAGDTIAIKDYSGTFGTNNLTIQRNGHNIQGNANNGIISTNRASLVLVYVDSTKGWIYTNESNVADLQATQYISATGGTITTSGDYKIHTFTGDGCFVVATAGTGQAPSTVDYMVVAGGGAGGNGNVNDGGAGGGAGGFRESHSTPVSGPYTASPLATSTGITVSVTTYPVTVGAGGAPPGGACQVGNPGSNSVFSTITSSGGGGGDANGGGPYGGSGNGVGGSGGGGHQSSGANGNTPPVSPPQGNPGGNGSFPSGTPSGAGGGGAGATGGDAASTWNPGPNNGGQGGGGVTSSINGTPTARAGGGGGSNSPGRASVGSAGTGGSGGGGNGGGSAGGSATANTGGGGGGGAGSSSGGGGKGIVILRYKYQ